MFASQRDYSDEFSLQTCSCLAQNLDFFIRNTHNFTVFSIYAKKCNIFNLIDIGSIMESGENSFFYYFCYACHSIEQAPFFARSVFRQKEAPYACDIIPHLIQKTELLLQIRIIKIRLVYKHCHIHKGASTNYVYKRRG